jgi:hypothetical protein
MNKTFRPSKIFLVIFVLALIRIIAPYIITQQINSYLGTFSPIYYGEIKTFRMSLWRGAYGMEFLQLHMRDKPVTFLTVSDIDVSIAWREILRGKIKTDIVTKEVRLLYSDYVLERLAQKPKDNVEKASEAGAKLFPVSIERIRFIDAAVNAADFFGVTDKLPVMIENVNGEVTNLTPDKQRQISYFQVKGDFPKGSDLEVSGLFNLTLTPTEWEAKTSVKDFDLLSVNPWMYNAAPLTFEKGKLTLFSEVKSEKGIITGYAKPFLQNVGFVGDEKDFKGFSQLGIEISLATLNRLFRSSSDKTVAAKIEFTYAKNEFKWNFWDVTKSLFKNGYVEPLEKGFDSEIQNP